MVNTPTGTQCFLPSKALQNNVFEGEAGKLSQPWRSQLGLCLFSLKKINNKIVFSIISYIQTGCNLPTFYQKNWRI